MANYLAPGVYVEEFDSGVKLMEGVSTSNAGFLGQSERGPVIGKPQLIVSMAQFKEIYGSPLDPSYEKRFLYYGVEQFFNNGGTTCYVMRVVSSNDTLSNLRIGEEEKEENPPSVTSLSFEAKNVGVWGNDIRISFKECQGMSTNIIKIVDETNLLYQVKDVSIYNVGDLVRMKYKITTGDTTEEFDIETRILEINSNDSMIRVDEKIDEKLIDTSLLPKYFLSVVNYQLDIYTSDTSESFQISLNENSLNFIDHIVKDSSNLVNSCLIKKKEITTKDEYTFNETLLEKETYALIGGTSTKSLSNDDYYGKDDGPQKRTGLEAFKELDNVSIMLMPGIYDPEIQMHLLSHCESMKNRFAILDAPESNVKVEDLKVSRSYFDTSFGAIYHPWVLMYDSLQKRTISMPPSGSVAGVYARVDNDRGVHKAPANEVIRNITGLKTNYNEVEQGLLNPNGINLIRSLPGSGIRIWGARTMTSDRSWKYINVRRLFIYIEESIRANTQWAVFEANDEVLWTRVSATIIMFLTTCWKDGMLSGSSPEEAFYVRCGKNTMSQDDILKGRLICEIGVALVRPAEFVIFRMTQKMQDNE